jgi:cell division protein YceG involved in septum cleavage
MKKWLSGLNFFQKTLLVFFLLVIIFSGVTIFKTLGKIYMPNVTVSNKTEAYVNIPTGSTLEDVCNILYKNNHIINRSSFEWLA